MEFYQAKRYSSEKKYKIVLENIYFVKNVYTAV